MGQSSSVLNRRQIENNQLLQELFGKETIPLEEPFWNQFLSFQCNAIVTKSINTSLWDVLDQKYGSLLIENYRSGNIVNLVAIFIKYSKTILSIYQSGDSDQGNADILIKQVRNALLVLRFVFQEMTLRNGCSGGLLLLEVECLPQEHPERHENSEAINVFDEFVSHILRLLLYVPVNEASLELHLEILLTCFVLLSCHLFGNVDVVVEDCQNTRSEKRAFLSAMKQHSTELSKYLFSNITNIFETPKSVVNITLSVTDDRPTSIMVASFDWLRSFFGSNDIKAEESDDEITTGGDVWKSQVTRSDLCFALANHSLIMCILLSCSDFSYLDSTDGGNPFLNALASFTDSEIQIVASSLHSSDNNNNELEASPPFRLPVSNICNALSNSLCDGIGVRRRPSLVLLYLLLHRNSTFKACALSRSDIDRLVVPLLRILYSYTSFKSEGMTPASDSSSAVNQNETPMGKAVVSSWQRDHAYLALICLLIFTEDDAFCRFANDLTLSSKTLLSFYAEHGDVSTLGNHPTLASISLLVLLRAIRRNLLVGRDHYLHTSCLAALANLCAHSTDLHSAVASRLVDLLVALARRRVRLCAILRSGTNESTSLEETEGALSATDDTARLLLEAINAALMARGKGPVANANLVVSLLREQETIIAAFRSVSNFQDLLQNIQFVVEYFAASMERESSPSPTPQGHPSTSQHKSFNITMTSVSEVLSVVKRAGSHFPVSRLRKMPDLKFHYVEESSASSHFFLPYSMALYQRYCFIYWPKAEATKAFKEKTKPDVLEQSDL